MRKRLNAVRSMYVHDIPSYKFPGSSSNTDLVSILSCDLFTDLHVASVAASSQAFICLTQPAGAGSGFKSHARVLMVNFHSTSFTLTPVDALEGVQTCVLYSSTRQTILKNSQQIPFTVCTL